MRVIEEAIVGNCSYPHSMPLTTTISSPATTLPEAVCHSTPATLTTIPQPSETLSHPTSTATPCPPPSTPQTLAHVSASATTPSTLPIPPSLAPSIFPTSFTLSAQPSLPPSTQPPSYQPLPLNTSKHKNPIPSTSINRSKPITSSNVMEKYPCMCMEGSVSLLSVLLAEEAFFGQDVLVRCTPNGARGRPSLPARELADWKVVLFGQCPSCWCIPEKFEVRNSILDNLG